MVECSASALASSLRLSVSRSLSHSLPRISDLTLYHFCPPSRCHVAQARKLEEKNSPASSDEDKFAKVTGISLPSLPF